MQGDGHGVWFHSSQSEAGALSGGRAPNPLADVIKADRASGMTRATVAAKNGVSYGTVVYHTRDMEPRPRTSPPYDVVRRCGLMTVGQMGLTSRLNERQLIALDAEARKIGCETLTEAALEILRDYLEEVAG